MLNPYASFIGERDPRAVIADTAGRLKALADRLGPAEMERRPAPGKWCAREILCHLADVECVFAMRLRQTLAQPHHTIQPMDQNDWATRYGGLEANTALETFSAVRRWNLALLSSVGTEEWSKPVTHPERGTMTFQTIVETMAGHDLNHVRQLETIAAQ